MFSAKTIVALAVAAAAAMLAGLAEAGEGTGPTVAVDFEGLRIINTATIDSIYCGGQDTIYAFLVVDDMPGGYVSGYHLACEILSPDSSVVNLGFSTLPGWRTLDASQDGLPDGVRLPGAETPAIIGFWTLRLVRECSSRGEFRILPNLRNHNSSIVLYDRGGLPVTPNRLISGLINPESPMPNDQPPKPPRLVPLNCLGEPIKEMRGCNYVPGEVIARFTEGTVELPDGLHSGTVDHVVRPAVKDALSEFRMNRIERICKKAERGAETVVSPEGGAVGLLSMWDVYLLEFSPESDIWGIVDSLRSLPLCEYAEPNYRLTMRALPNDPWIEEYPWQAFVRIQVPAAFDMEVGDETVRIGIVDSGIEYAHPDLGLGFGFGCKVVDGWDYTDDDSDPAPESWGSGPYRDHGTSVAGAAAALANNGICSAGVAGGWVDATNGCSLVALRCDSSPDGIDLDNAIEAISDAHAQYACQVVNTSWGMMDYSEGLRSAVFNAHAAGVVFVAADGYIDEGDTAAHEQSYPDDYDYDWVICVGASQLIVHPEEQRLNFSRVSEYGYGLDVLAPGCMNTAPWTPELWFPSGIYQCGPFGGTSGAAPQVAGIAGLLRSDSLGLCVDDVEGLISASCVDITYDYVGGDSLIGFDQWSGWGRVCADSGLRFLRSPWIMEHHVVQGPTVVLTDSVIWPFRMFGEDRPVPPYGGEWKAERWDLRRDITYPEGYCAIRAWGRGYGASSGWSAANPNYMAGFCRVVDGSRTLTGCQLQAFVYSLYYWDPYRERWQWYEVYPAAPGDVEFAYTIVACPGEASVTDRNREVVALATDFTVVPNPASKAVSFSLSLSEPCPVSISVYSIDGRFIRRLVFEGLRQGHNELAWDGMDSNGDMVAPGVYVCRLTAGGFRATGKVILVE